jgi:prophage regulatory protein
MLDEVQEMVRYTRAHIDRLEKAGQFPRRIRLGANRIVWRQSEVLAWLEAKRQDSTAI